MSTVLKSGLSGKIIRRLDALDLADHVGEARTVIEDARRQSEAIIEEASQRARRDGANAGEQARVEGYEKGYQEGLAAGRTDAFERAKAEFAEQHGNLVRMMQAAIAGVDGIKEQLRLEAEADVLDFVVLAASKLTFAIGDLHREAAAENLRCSLALVADKTSIRIRCNPKDAETLREIAESIAQSTDCARHVVLVEDDSIAAGGCVVQSGSAEVDATLETQVAQMAAILTGKVNSA